MNALTETDIAPLATPFAPLTSKFFIALAHDCGADDAGRVDDFESAIMPESGTDGEAAAVDCATGTGLYEQRDCGKHADLRIYGEESRAPDHASIECTKPLRGRADGMREQSRFHCVNNSGMPVSLRGRRCVVLSVFILVGNCEVRIEWDRERSQVVGR